MEGRLGLQVMCFRPMIRPPLVEKAWMMERWDLG